MLAVSPLSAYVVTLGPTLTISAKAPVPVLRSILKPSSFVDASVQFRVIAVLEVAVAPSPVGAVGGRVEVEPTWYVYVLPLVFGLVLSEAENNT